MRRTSSIDTLGKADTPTTFGTRRTRNRVSRRSCVVPFCPHRPERRSFHSFLTLEKLPSLIPSNLSPPESLQVGAVVKWLRYGLRRSAFCLVAWSRLACSPPSAHFVLFSRACAVSALPVRPLIHSGIRPGLSTSFPLALLFLVSSHFSYHPLALSPPCPTTRLSDAAVPGQYPSPPIQETSHGAPGAGTSSIPSTGSFISPARDAVTRPRSPSSRAENASQSSDHQGVQSYIEASQAAVAGATDPGSASLAGNATLSLERPPVQLYRVPSPGLRGSPGALRPTVAVAQAWPSRDRASAARNDQSPSTMGAIFDAMGAFRNLTYDPNTGVFTAGGAGAAAPVGTGGGAASGGTGLLRFTALLNRELLQDVSVV